MNNVVDTNPNIIYITEEEHRREWTHSSTKELLKLYDEKSDMLETGIITTQKKLWELVSKALAKKGFQHTGAQCENKWKALKRTYRAKLDRIQKFGTSKRNCPFEYEIAEILSKRPNDRYTRGYSFKINELKKREEDLFNVNLNEPPGFTKDDDEYSLSDDFHIKDVKILEENMDDSTLEEQNENNEETYTVVQDESQALLIDELSDIKRMINKHNRINMQILQHSNDIQEKVLQYFQGVAKRETRNLEIEEAKIAQQNEILNQMKLQNSLLERLLEKLE